MPRRSFFCHFRVRWSRGDEAASKVNWVSFTSENNTVNVVTREAQSGRLPASVHLAGVFFSPGIFLAPHVWKLLRCPAWTCVCMMMMRTLHWCSGCTLASEFLVLLKHKSTETMGFVKQDTGIHTPIISWCFSELIPCEQNPGCVFFSSVPFGTQHPHLHSHVNSTR